MMHFEISNMLRPEVYDHPVNNIELIETHISWVVLTGDFAYKIKKPVDFGFLDFSTLEKRHMFCEQELRLNRRLAADIYLDVVAISGTVEKPVISTDGEVLEYAVKMRQFPQSAQLDHMLSAGKLNIEHIEAIALMIAAFHQAIPVADDIVVYGNKEAVYRPVEENFSQIREHIDTTLYADTLAALQGWNVSQIKKLATLLEHRKADGYIRECHGDMHLRNLIWLEGKPMAFDCIEFNPELRWIDVISEIAFFIMDLQARKQYQLANRFLNTYLEITGDYEGLRVLPFYLCYRALVRAKVDVLVLAQKNISRQARENSITEFEAYLQLASTYTQPSTPRLIVMRGVSASGKSTISRQLLDKLGAIRIRSDVERKRLFNIEVNDSALSDIDTGIYSANASQRTYEKLLELAEQIIDAGYSVIVDAAFLDYQQRTLFQTLAQRLDVGYVILEITAPAEVLRRRIVQRKGDVSDANLTVLEHQLLNWQALKREESDNAISVNTDEAIDINKIIDGINSRCRY